MNEHLELAVKVLAKIRKKGTPGTLDDLNGVPAYLWPAIDKARTLPADEAVALLAETLPPDVAPADEPLTDDGPTSQQILDALSGGR